MSWLALVHDLRPPTRKAAISAASGGFLIALICWYLGANVWHSILFGAVVTTAAVVLNIAGNAEIRDTDWRGDARSNRLGSRQDVSSLSWSVRGGYGTVGHAAVWRARRTAQQRLARYQLDLVRPSDRAQIEELIGRRAYRVLTRGDRRAPFLRTFLQSLDALDALDPVHYPQRQPASPRRRLRLRAFRRPTPPEENR